MGITTKILNIVYCLTVLLFLLDGLTSFDIKSQGIKSFVYFGILIGTLVTLVWNLFAFTTKTNKIVGTVFPTIIFILTLIIGPMKILFSIGAWQTQEILYQNERLKIKTVEFQMRDVGALGYRKRTVEVLYLTPLFMITNEVPKDIDKRAEWIKVDIDVNELGLKSP